MIIAILEAEILRSKVGLLTERVFSLALVVHKNVTKVAHDEHF